jgi:hypothetical protein
MSKTGDFTEKYPPKICPICGNPFAKPSTYSLTQWATKAYCSTRCLAVSRRKNEIIETGYCFIWVDDERLQRSRVIAEQKLRRPLRPGEVVHHINGDTMDDRPENLRVFASNGDHMAQHWRENPWQEQLAQARAAHWPAKRRAQAANTD